MHSTLRLILADIRTHLSKALDLPAERISITPTQSYEPQSDQDIQIVVGPALSVETWSSSNGRDSLLIHRQIGLALRTRVSLDTVDDASIGTLDQNIGHLAFEDQVLDAIHIYMPGEKLTIEPLHYVETTGSERPSSNSQGPPFTALGYGLSTLWLSVRYEALLTPTLTA